MRLTNQTLTTHIRALKKAGALLSLSVLIGAGFAMPHIRADQFDDQINALQAQNGAAQGVLNGLESQAASLQDVVNQLQAQINAIQAQIAANVAEQQQLQDQITQDEQKIAYERSVLGDDLKDMYVDGQLSTIEELATSNSLSDYVDKQTIRENIQSNIQTTLKQIAELEAKLKQQKVQVDTLIESEKTQNAQLAADQAKQQELLNMNESQQATYNSQIASNNSQISELRRQQAIVNSRYNIGNFRGDPGNGGYPSQWAYAPQDSMIDDWGMYNRECVSYTAYRVHQDFLAGRNSHDMPWWGGVGNANQWDDDARAAGIPVDYNPTPGSIAISNAGTWGHAMYVEAVNGNQIYIQQYNQQLTGQYSEGWRYTTGLVFIHF